MFVMRTQLGSKAATLPRPSILLQVSPFRPAAALPPSPSHTMASPQAHRGSRSPSYKAVKQHALQAHASNAHPPGYFKEHAQETGRRFNRMDSNQARLQEAVDRHAAASAARHGTTTTRIGTVAAGVAQVHRSVARSQHLSGQRHQALLASGNATQAAIARLQAGQAQQQAALAQVQSAVARLAAPKSSRIYRDEYVASPAVGAPAKALHALTRCQLYAIYRAFRGLHLGSRRFPRKRAPPAFLQGNHWERIPHRPGTRQMMEWQAFVGYYNERRAAVHLPALPL